MFTTAAQKELNQWNQSHLNNLGGGEEKKKKKTQNRKQNPSAVQVYRLLGLKRGKSLCRDEWGIMGRLGKRGEQGGD